jgi:hypothetical protein
MYKVYLHVYLRSCCCYCCIFDDEHEIEVHCAAMGMKSLFYLHCNYYMTL